VKCGNFWNILIVIIIFTKWHCSN